MDEQPLSVAVAAVVRDDSILLLRRERGDYIGMWSLPGGKIEQDEHAHEAAVREVREEAGIETSFVEHAGVVSEHLVRDGQVDKHFLIHVCLLDANDVDVEGGEEGAVDWVALDEIDALDAVLPSDRAMIAAFVEDRERGYHHCVMEAAGDTPTLLSFS